MLLLSTLSRKRGRWRHLARSPAATVLLAMTLAVTLQPAQVPQLSLPWRGMPSELQGVHPTDSPGWMEHYIFRWFRLQGSNEVASKVDASQKGLSDDLQRLGRLARHEWFTLSLGIGFLLTAAAFRTVIPQAVASTLIVALKPAEASAEMQREALMRAARRLAMLAMGYGIFSGLRGLMMSIAENRLLLRLRQQTFSRLLQQDIAFHDMRDVGELTSRLNSDCEAVASGLSVNLNIFLRNGVQLVFGVCYLTITSWKLSLILLGVWAVLFYVYAVYGKFARRSSLLRQDRLAALNSVATEVTSGVASFFGGFSSWWSVPRLPRPIIEEVKPTPTNCPRCAGAMPKCVGANFCPHCTFHIT